MKIAQLISVLRRLENWVFGGWVNQQIARDQYRALHGHYPRTEDFDASLPLHHLAPEHLRSNYDGRTFKAGDRVRVLPDVFMAGTKGTVSKSRLRSFDDRFSVYWVIHDGSQRPVMYAPWELELVEQLDRPADKDILRKVYRDTVTHAHERQTGASPVFAAPYGDQQTEDEPEHWAAAARIACCNDPCYVVQHGDSTECRTCQLAWDTNDMFPPSCPYEHQRKEPR